MTDNPSIVNDASGNNYGGINTGASTGQAQMAYLENINSLIQKMPTKPLSNNQYFPGAGEGPQVGSYSGSMVGNVPIFAPTNLIPFGMLDEIKRNEAEKEAEYYKNFKTYLDKPISDIKAKLSNPWAQPEFNNKLQTTIDTWLDAYSAKFGGNYMKAYVALQNDKEFNKIMTGYSQYADIYNSVFKEATETLVKAQSPTEYYVSPAQIESINRFLHAHDNLENLSIDELGKKAEEFAAKQSVFKIAEAATAGIQNDIMTTFDADPTMSTKDKIVYIKTKTTGEKGQAQKLYDTNTKAYPWILEDPANAALFKSQLENKIKYEEEKTIEQIEVADAKRDAELEKYGLGVDANGNPSFPTKPAALVNAQGSFAVTYNTTNAKPIQSVVNSTGYIIHNGKLRYVRLPESYSITPTSEYDITDPSSGVERGRYVESSISFGSTGVYTPENVRINSTLDTQVSLGPGRGASENQPAVLKDAFTGETIEVYGESTILFPFDQMKSIVVANIPHMNYMHAQLEKAFGPYTKRRENLDKGGTKHKSQATLVEPIPLNEGDGMDKVQDSPYIKYLWGGKVLTGAEVWDKVGREPEKKK